MMADNWIDQLESRKRDEAEFHDRDRDSRKDEDQDSTPNRRFYNVAEPVKLEVERWLASAAPGACFLDYACGNGKFALEAARLGAELAIGIDISAVSVRNATAKAAEEGVSSRVRFLQRDCESTGLPDSSFDACLCSGMLHHLDLNRAFPELHRVMVPGGRIFCLEALSYNPVIQWYRNRTPELRTAWEKDHILGLKDLQFAQQWFRVENVRFHLLLAPLSALLPAPLRAPAAKAAHAVDALLTRIPLLQRLSWQFSFELVKA